MTQIDRRIARHELINGTGSVIAYQVENEYYNGSPAGRAYMQDLENKARADGITVPLTGNNNGTFNSGTGALNVDGPDSYPQGFNCSNPARRWRSTSAIRVPVRFSACPQATWTGSCASARSSARSAFSRALDCGFDTFIRFSQVDPAVAWLKLKSLSEGAEIASAEL